MILPYWSAPASGVLLHFVPKGLKRLFPEKLDGYIAQSVRTAFRAHFDQKLDRRDEKLQRLVRVVIPDNMGIASFVLAAYLASNKYNIMLKEDLPILLTTYLTLCVASHVFRELSHTFLSPILSKLPCVGKALKSLFKMIGPSDLS